MKVLVQDFVESPDANLRLVGLTTLSSKVNAENGAVFCQRLLTKLKNEEINGIMACLVKMLRKLATKDNYQQVIGGLMQKDPDVVLDSLMDIETELQDTPGFKAYFLANVTLPLLQRGIKEDWLGERLMDAVNQ